MHGRNICDIYLPRGPSRDPVGHVITGLPCDCCYLHGIKTCDVVVVHAADVCVGARIGACRHLGFGGHVGVAVTRHWSFFRDRRNEISSIRFAHSFEF